MRPAWKQNALMQVAWEQNHACSLRRNARTRAAGLGAHGRVQPRLRNIVVVITNKFGGGGGFASAPC